MSKLLALVLVVIVAGCGAVRPVAPETKYADVIWQVPDGSVYDLGFRADGVVVWRKHVRSEP